MAVTVIMGPRDPAFKEVEDLFYANFDPDDWDHIILGDDGEQVEDLADRLGCHSFECVLKHIDGRWVAVTYHG
jgi:hypothetical protein